MQSIQKRLTVSLLIGLPILWLGITSLIVTNILQEINEISDTQITQVARYLLGTVQFDTVQLDTVELDQADSSDNTGNTLSLPSALAITPKIIDLNLTGVGDVGQAKDNYMGFAIWDNKGRLLMADNNGKNFTFLSDYQGFKNSTDIGDNPLQWLVYVLNWNETPEQWRLFYVMDSRTHNIIAVGENLISRREIIVDTLQVQLLPAFIGLLLFIGLVVWLVRQGFNRLKPVIEQIDNRALQDTTPITGEIPSEILPLVTALNQRFIKVADTLAREQRFTADASHELRSPLTALKLQNQVLQQQLLQLPFDETIEASLFEQTQKIGDGIERANHLVEQLLTLAKLEPQLGTHPADTTLEAIDWLVLSDTVLQEVNRHAREKYIQLKRTVIPTDFAAILPLRANPIYMQILLRNLLDNAIRYCPNGSVVELILDRHCVIIQDNGNGVSSESLARLSERFYRPAGQTQQGSGLGLSIVRRIADLYGLSLRFNNRLAPMTGFEVLIFNKL